MGIIRLKEDPRLSIPKILLYIQLAFSYYELLLYLLFGESFISIFSMNNKTNKVLIYSLLIFD
ncbi:MAG: hypothetical protein DBO99_20120 [gamma proteobacterium symbiont of Ctena orbiculata]|nr:MAG: hypothetical protein DBO99_20120 [gamma proteobacterium symbiont of Ctena orbiculata]